MKPSLAIAALSLSALASAQTAPKFLTIGDPAPTLKNATWLKGEPVPAFKKGEVYVVEFWATWCGPCKENIPHLTELAKKYQDKVSIIGISIWESLDEEAADPLKKVKSFVTDQGEQMNYIVAADNPKNTIADSWMKPASEGGIPCSFIVNGEGQVAWIGHPAKMETALIQVLDGTYDLEAAREKREVELKITRPIDTALANRDYPALLKAIDSAIKQKPDMEYALTYNRFVALFHTDLAQGKEYAKKILAESEKAPGAYQMMTSIFAVYDDFSKEAYLYGLSLADEVISQHPKGLMFHAIRGEICFHMGRKAEALKSIKEAIALAEAEPNVTPEFRETLKKSLAKYQAMKG